MKVQLSRLAFIACLPLCASACGQKGPLFLPGDPSSIQTEIPEPPGPVDEPEDGDDTEDDAGTDNE